MPDQQPKERILICEDEAIIAADLEKRLRGLGYTICGRASTGHVAIEMVEQHQPDLVMMDIVIQGEMGGIAAAEVIRERWGMPVVFLLANADSEWLERAGPTYPFGYIIKPIQDKELKITIEMALYVAKVDAERKKAEQALAENEEKLRILYDKSPLPYQSLDEQGNFLEVNQTWLDVLGYTRGEVIGRNFGNFLSSQWKDHFKANFSKFKAIGEVLGVEFDMVKKDGSSILVRFNGKIEKNTAGEFEKTHCIFHDITRQRKVEQELAHANANMKTILESIPADIYLSDMDTYEILYMNANMIKSFGRDCTGETCYRAFRGEEEPCVHCTNSRLLDDNGEPGEVITWEDFNPINKKFYLNHDKAIWWPDRRYVRLQIATEITERKKSEEILFKSEEHLRTILQTAMDGFWLVDLDGRVLEINDAYCQMSGYNKQELLAMKITDLEAKETPANTSWHMEMAIEHGEDRFEGIHRRKDGTTFNVEVSMQYQPMEGGRIVAFLRDITKRKQDENRRQEGFDLLNNLARLVPGVIYQYRLYPDGRSTFPYSSPGMYDIYEVTPEEVREDASVVFGRIHPEDLDRVSEAIFESARTLNTFYCELRVVLPEKGLGWRWSQAHPERTEDGGTLWHGIILDITKRKLAEEALREQEQRLRAIMTHSPLLISEVDSDGRYQQVNPALASMFQMEASEILGKRFHDMLPAKTADLFMQRISGVMDMKRPITIEDQLPESKQSFITTLFPLFDDTGNIRSICSIAHDITDRKQAEEEREKLQAQLQQAHKMEAIGTLTGGVAHDFNNLLQAINGYAQLLLMDRREDDPEYQSLAAIQKSGNRASDLVRSLLLFSRKADTERKPVELNQEVEQARRILERTIPKMIDIDIHLGRRLWTINADPVQMEQILLNLGTNAADAMPDGGRLIIETTNTTLDDHYVQNHLGAQPGRYVQLTISDTGHGMDRETRDKIFEPFFTTKEFGKGTGLGLASVYGIVRNHGGYITCYSEVGQGTSFKVFLPAMEHAEKEKEKDAATERPKGGNETILLVDDEEAIRGFAEQALMKFGYKVFTASTGEEALEVYQNRTEEIDLVITDLGMPGMGGHKFLQELLQTNPMAKVLIASGYCINDQVKKSMEAGALGYVGKPYQLSELLGCVRNALGEKQNE